LVSLPSDATNTTPSSLVDQTPRYVSTYPSDMPHSVWNPPLVHAFPSHS
jgi:hypothetical protein